MKRNSLLIIVIIISIKAHCQDYKIGIRFSPMNGAYMSDDGTALNQGVTDNNYAVTGNDSLTIGLFAEKYFAGKSFFLRADINYVAMNITTTNNMSSHDPFQDNSSEYTQTETQKILNINLGVGTHAAWNQFNFNFGVFVPLNILPEGKIKRTANQFTNSTLTQSSTGDGTYKPALGLGIGSFIGLNTIIAKHISLGMDISYKIEYLSRDLKWHGETNVLGSNPYTTSADENITIRNYYSSKLIPSIGIAYTFDCKKSPKRT